MKITYDPIQLDLCVQFLLDRKTYFYQIGLIDELYTFENLKEKIIELTKELCSRSDQDWVTTLGFLILKRKFADDEFFCEFFFDPATNVHSNFELWITMEA